MDITTLRIISTLATFVAFVSIWIWAWFKSNKNDFDEAAHIPFEGDDE